MSELAKFLMVLGVWPLGIIVVLFVGGALGKDLSSNDDDDPGLLVVAMFWPLFLVMIVIVVVPASIGWLAYRSGVAFRSWRKSRRAMPMPDESEVPQIPYE